MIRDCDTGNQAEIEPFEITLGTSNEKEFGVHFALSQEQNFHPKFGTSTHTSLHLLELLPKQQRFSQGLDLR